MESAEPDKGVLETLLGGPDTDPRGNEGTVTGGQRGHGEDNDHTDHTDHRSDIDGDRS
jgi:hypothetical protein